MNEFNVETTYKKQIDTIWNNEKYQNIPFKERGYAIQCKIPLNSILFIGINPSFNEKKSKRYENFFYDVHLNDKYQYFKKFKDISEKVEVDWSHFDLLFIRETNQNNIKQIYSKEFGKDFLNEQLSISKNVIENSKPKVIVISNAYARDLFYYNCEIETVFDESLGTHKIINNKNLEGTPIFFTSMLTGQRALDNGSYDRLVWHIKYVLNKK